MAFKTNVHFVSKDTENAKIFNTDGNSLDIKTLIALVNKYDEFKQAGMIIWLLGYYSFILDRNLDVKRHFKLFKEIQVFYAQQVNLNPNNVQIQQIRRSLERTANRLSEQINFWTDMYRNLNERNGDR